MQKNPIGWFEMPVSDMDRAEKFYRDFFGFAMQRQEEQGSVLMSWFPSDMETYGATGTLIKGEMYVPSREGTLVYFTAPKGGIDSALQKAEEMNVTIVVGKRDIGEYGTIAIIEDTEGNRIALHEAK